MNEDLNLILMSLSDYLNQLIISLPFLVNFYKNNDERNISEYAPMFVDGINCITNTISSTKGLEDIEMDKQNEIFERMLRHMKKRENIITADILDIELLPKLKECAHNIEKKIVF